MPTCDYCGKNIDWDEQFIRHETEWCDERPADGQQTLEEAAH
ncbi:hypothetical protein [Haloarcula sp. Atlit-120R]|nr:hypothetical protein [Haloarcula sp. Atlit-120R]